MLQVTKDMRGFESDRLVNPSIGASVFQSEGMASDILKNLAEKAAKDADVPVAKSRKRTKSNVSFIELIHLCFNINPCVLCVC